MSLLGFRAMVRVRVRVRVSSLEVVMVSGFTV
jgi:hypothetical protein